MPAQPAWFHRFDEILATLRGVESTHLDRLAVQKLFSVRERRARQIMAGAAGFDRASRRDGGGRGLSVGSEPPRRQLAARRARIPAAADVQDRRVRDLPGNIALKPGELRIEFYGAEDLAAKLLELSQAMVNDWRAFTEAVEETRPQPDREGAVKQ